MLKSAGCLHVTEVGTMEEPKTDRQPRGPLPKYSTTNLCAPHHDRGNGSVLPMERRMLQSMGLPWVLSTEFIYQRIS